MNFKDEVSGDKQISVTLKCRVTFLMNKPLYTEQAIAGITQARHDEAALV
jgi:hypothetical protein